MLLEMRSICKDYPQGKDVVHILKNISLEIDDGDYPVSYTHLTLPTIYSV